MGPDKGFPGAPVCSAWSAWTPALKLPLAPQGGSPTFLSLPGLCCGQLRESSAVSWKGGLEASIKNRQHPFPGVRGIDLLSNVSNGALAGYRIHARQSS